MLTTPGQPAVLPENADSSFRHQRTHMIALTSNTRMERVPLLYPTANIKFVGKWKVKEPEKLFRRR
jgi:hypothetical protein